MVMLRGVLALVLCAAANLALGGPVVDQLFALRQQNSANSNNFATGDILFWGASNVPGGASLWGVTRQCPTGANCADQPAPDPDLVRQALYYRPFTVFPDQYFASRPYDPNLTGPWTLVVSSNPAFPPDPAQTTVVLTPAVGSAGQMPFVPSMTVSGAGLTPSLTWTLPSAADLASAGVQVDRVRINILDNTPGYQVTTTSRSPSFTNSFQQGDLISFEIVPSGNSYTVPSGLLQYGHSYSIGVMLEDTRNDGTVQSRSSSYFDFTPLNIPNANSVFLPTTVPVPTTSGLTSGALYSFTRVPASSDPNSVTFIDPVVATGFEYHTAGGGDPNFRTVQIVTDVGDGVYEVWLWNGSD